MKSRWLAMAMAAGLLGGCTNADWDKAFDMVGLGNGPQSQSGNTQADSQNYPPPSAQSSGFLDDLFSYPGVGNAPPSSPAEADYTPPPTAPAYVPASPPPVTAQPSNPNDITVPNPVALRNSAPPQSAPAGQADWCRGVAHSAAMEAAGNGFDAATQQRRADAVYRQCAGMRN